MNLQKHNKFAQRFEFSSKFMIFVAYINHHSHERYFLEYGDGDSRLPSVGICR